MKLLLLSVACLCMLAQIQAQGLFNRFFGNTGGDPCANNNCVANSRCQTSSFGYTCTCNDGYTGNARVVCSDVNECLRSHTNTCNQGETCVNTPGSYSCVCPTGYSKRNGRCRDVNECLGSPCPQRSTCVNNDGSYTCACSTGYTMRNGACRDINECQGSSPCSQRSNCRNTQGSYTCVCKPGYVQRNGACRRRVAPTTRPTTPTTTRTTPRVTTRVPSDLDLCKGKNRTWTDCVGNPPTRFTTDSCAPRSQICTDGVLLGNLFTKNFLGPSIDGSSSPEGSRTGNNLGGGTGARTLNPGQASNSTQCVVQNVTNANGAVIAGKCVLPGQSGNSRSKRQAGFTEYIPTKRDLLIMLDESFSVGQYRYEKVKRIAAAIVKLLCEDIKVNLQYTRVAVTSFNGRVYFNIKLKSIRRLRYLDNNANSLANYIIRQLTFHGGYNARRTCLISALEHAYNTALDSNNGGRRGDPNVEQDIIIISDGCENCVSPYRRKQQILEITSFFIRQGVHVYVIGIGLTDQCKETLSYLAQGGRCFHFFYLTEWDYDVDDFLFQLENPPQGLCLNVFENPSGQCLAPL